MCGVLIYDEKLFFVFDDPIGSENLTYVFELLSFFMGENMTLFSPGRLCQQPLQGELAVLLLNRLLRRVGRFSL